jgi:phosphoglycolate phosphatase
LYIGDEKRDIEFCNKCGVDIIYVAWGLGIGENIDGLKVKAIVHKPEELLEYLTGEK